MALSLHLTCRTFLVIDGLGLHLSLFGKELAWTRGFGLVVG
jgi:hypothetical protein